MKPRPVVRICGIEVETEGADHEAAVAQAVAGALRDWADGVWGPLAVEFERELPGGVVQVSRVVGVDRDLNVVSNHSMYEGEGEEERADGRSGQGLGEGGP